MNSCRSLPAENAPGPPAITTQRMSSLVIDGLRVASAMASYIDAVSAFFLSGRFIRTVRIAAVVG